LPFSSISAAPFRTPTNHAVLPPNPNHRHHPPSPPPPVHRARAAAPPPTIRPTLPYPTLPYPTRREEQESAARAALAAATTMCAAMYRKRSSSFFDDPSQAEAPSPPPPSKRARFRGDGSPRPRGAAVNPDLVAALRARFPSVRLEVMMEPCCSNPFCQLNRVRASLSGLMIGFGNVPCM
jgi:hypothetical protein